MQAEDFAGAARLAFQLNHSGRLLSVITAAAERGVQACAALLGNLVADWDATQLASALKSIAQWNTNSRHCHAAHALLHAILLRHPLEVGICVQLPIECMACPSQRDGVDTGIGP